MKKNKDWCAKGTLEHFKRISWRGMNNRSCNTNRDIEKAMKHKNTARYLNKKIELRMSKAEFFIWCHINWESAKLIIDSGKVPSIDRIDSSGHYEINNIRIVERGENARIARSKPVQGKSIKTGKVIFYPSALAASKDGFNFGCIRRCISGDENRKQHKGYFWTEKGETNGKS